MRILDRARQAGCIATGVATFALFFAVGVLVSLMSGDFLTTFQALAVTALLGGLALWLERRHRRTARATSPRRGRQ
jgi:hypothetical protein